MAKRVKIIDDITGEVKWSEASDPIDAEIQSALDGKEDSFAKNTAFNKDFGTIAGTVLEGDTTTITPTQSSDITSNNSKVSFPEAPIDGSQYSRKDGNWEVVNTVAPSDMAGLMIERTTDLALTGTFQEVEFDTTSLENDVNVLEHNNTNTERAQIKTSGLHQLAMSFNCNSTSNTPQVLEAELRVNGTPVKTLTFNVSKSAEELVARVLLSDLIAGTYLTVAFREGGAGGTDLTLKANSVVSITKLQGTKGEKGDTGAGANIIVKDEGITQGTVIDTMDFVGNGVSVSETSGKATVTINNDSSWQPPQINFSDASTIGVSVFINDDNAGKYYAFDGSSDDVASFNIPLENNGTSYDGSDLAIELFGRLDSNGGGTDTVGWVLTHSLLKNGDNTATSGTAETQQNIDVSSELANIGFTTQLTTINGVANATHLLFSIERNSAGAGQDSFTGTYEGLGLRIIKI